MEHFADSGTMRLGAPLARAQAAVILIHGRGSSPADIAGLTEHLPQPGWAFLAPAAEGGSWYPQRFFVPLQLNEPWLTQALDTIDGLVKEAQAAGLTPEHVGLIGFSQGACLALEYAARHPRRYGFIAGLSGALIGPPGTARPAGDLRATPVLLGCAESDPHIPLTYVEASAGTLTRLGADVTKHIFHGGAHTVFPAEIEWLQRQQLA